MLVAKRLRAHGGVFGALFAVVAIATGASSGLAGYLSAATTSGVRAAFSTAAGFDGALRIDVRSDGEAQDAAVRQLVSAQFPGVPLAVDRTVQTEPVPVEFGEVLVEFGAAPVELEPVPVDTPEATVRVVLAAFPVEERAALVGGSWATASDEGVLHADAARRWGVVPGDAVTLPDGTVITITGTWLPVDALDPIWFGESLAATGAAGEAIGPLVVDEATLEPLRPFARWVLHPDPTLVDADDLAAIVDGAVTLRDVLGSSDAVATGNVLVTGGMAELAARMDRSLDALSGVSPVPAVLLGAIGFVALVELARLLVRVRLVETGVLRARGASARRITATTAGEAGLVAVPAGALGAVAAGLVTGVVVWPIAAVVVIATAAVFAVVALLAARRPLNRETALDSGRGRRVAAVGLLVLALAAAIVSVWQFRLYGSPIVRGADGRTAVDPIAVLAPTLALLAGALIVVTLVTPATAVVQSVTRRARVGWALAGWQLARRVTVFATPVLLVSLAVGGTVVAATYGATWDRAATIARETGNGAAVRVVTPWPLAEVGGVDAAAPALTATLQAGDDRVRLLAVPADLLAAVVEPADGAVSGGAIASGIAAPPSVPLPAGTDSLQIAPAVADGAAADAAAVEVSLWLVDEWGAVQRLDAPFAVPAGQWSLGAIEFLGGSPEPLSLSAVTSDGVQSLPVDDWVEAPDVDSRLPRLVPPAALDIPIVVSQSFADRGSLAVGDEISLRFEGTGRRLAGTISGIVPVVPGAPTELAVVADLPAFAAQQLAVSETVPTSNEVWLATEHPAQVAAALASRGVLVTTDAGGPGDALLASGRVALWIGAAGALVLAAAAVGAVAGALLRDRAGEVVVLRAIGSGPRAQAASRRRELSLVLGWSLFGGIAIGILVSALTITELAASAVVGASTAVPVVLLVDGPAVGLALGVGIAGLAGLVVVYGALVARQARTLATREDAR